MNEKRFTVDGLTIAENSPKGRKYLLEYQCGVNALCNRINGLFDKSERLEKENTKLKTKINNELNKAMEILDGKRDLPPRTSIDYWVGINNILFNLKEDMK